MAEKEQKFEDKIKELETIINELENGTSDLEDSINKYTKAMKLVNECDEKLKSIEEQVNKIILENGEITDFEIEEWYFTKNTKMVFFCIYNFISFFHNTNVVCKSKGEIKNVF